MNWEHLYAVARFLLGGNDHKLQQQVKGRRCGFVIGRTRRQCSVQSVCQAKQWEHCLLFIHSYILNLAIQWTGGLLAPRYFLLWLIKYRILLMQTWLNWYISVSLLWDLKSGSSEKPSLPMGTVNLKLQTKVNTGNEVWFKILWWNCRWRKWANPSLTVVTICTTCCTLISLNNINHLVVVTSILSVI